MDELMDMMVDDASASQISDKLKDLLYAKSAERVDAHRTVAANSLFGDNEAEEDGVEAETETEVEAEAETEVEDEVEQPTAKLF
tara:strand:- start:7 stop:258 length:252 start_codon:yes stop_codon:yes gene_type:complete